ncbi:hypothetical protein RAS1_08960 [Phycisphaerae bacterium RAS1]|nr:hypothetical protein RAS1_08960 [Phycisphaerae bacterium RAS1]
MSSRELRPGDLTGRVRSTLFLVGDACFFAVVGVLATLTMHLAHEWGWGFLLSLLAGMVLAMIVQTLLALLVAPLLGSIESMVPSMMIAMISPMFVCGLHAVGCEPGPRMACVLGAASGLGMFFFVAAYGRASRRRFAASFPSG